MIHIHNLSNIYPDGTIGIKDVSMEIQKGEFVFLSGRSGSGKTTFIKLLLRDLAPSKGYVEINGQNIYDLPKKQIPYLRRMMGSVFQENFLLPNKTAYENVAFALQVTEQPKNLIDALTPTALALVGLKKKADQMPCQLSQGEQLRVCLARAIVGSPPILLCDEPTANLDPDKAWDMMCLLNEINHMGTTVIVATHAKELVNIMKKRVITFRHGQIAGDVKGGKYGYII